jgi:hypothetical protein
MLQPDFITDPDDVPVFRLFWSVDEATALQVAGADGGRVADDVVELHYTSPGAAGQTWKAYGVNATYLRVDGSLTSDTGPWTDLATGLADATAEDAAGTLWVRVVALRWAPGDENPELSFSLRLAAPGAAAIDEA